MSKLLDKVKGDPTLDVTVSFKMNGEKKEEYVDWCVKHKVSFGAVLREGVDMIMEKLIEEEKKGE